MTKQNFPLTTFGQLVELNPTVSLPRDETHPFVAMEDITPGYRYVRPSTVRKLAGGAKFAPGDTLFARITPCLENGKIAQFDPKARGSGFGSTEFIVIRARPGKADPAFVFYLSRTEWVRSTAIKSMAGASGRQRARQEAIAAAPVPNVSLRAQRKIAALLGAYDNLIDLNQQRIRLLEEMAKRLFGEWFVHFRYPGHEGQSIIETPNGRIPEGWHTGPAEELIDFDPQTRVPKDGRKPFIPMGSLSISNSLIEDIEWREGNSGAKFANKDTLFARITPCLEIGKTGLVRDLPGDGFGFGSTEFVVMRVIEAGPAFCYQLSRYDAFREHARRSMSGASGRQRVRPESLRSFKLNIPPDPLLEQFERVAWPLLELSGSLGAANGRLASCRDILLPRLVSGELSIVAAERELEDVA